MQHPRDTHLIVVKRIFRYLKGTLNIGLNFVKLLTLHFVVFVMRIGQAPGMSVVLRLALLSIWAITCCPGELKSKL
jgi:hypothetical protein